MKRSRAVGALAAVVMAPGLGGCGGGSDDQAVCPLSPSEITAVTGTVVGEPSVYDFEDHGFREIYGDTLRECIYPTTTDNTTDITVKILSIDLDAESSHLDEFREFTGTAEAHGRLWRVEADQTAHAMSEFDEDVAALRSYEANLLDVIVSGSGSPVTEGY